MKYITLIIFVYFLLTFTSCISTSMTVLDYDKVRPEIKNLKKVDIYMSKEDIPCEYEKIAIIKTKSTSDKKDMKFIKKARKAAAENGANGLLLIGVKNLSTGENLSNIFLWPSAYKWKKTMAIYVKDIGCKSK